MTAEAICDGCGSRISMESYGGSWHIPSNWFERTPNGEKTVTACSRSCIERIEKRRKEGGKESNPCVLPL